MIAKIKVLGLRAAHGRAIRVAAHQILEYLEGSGLNTPDAIGRTPALPNRLRSGDSPTGAVTYYQARTTGQSQGRARGAGAGDLGLEGSVSAAQLEAVLTGFHPATGVPLVGRGGSSARRGGPPNGARPVARSGPADEWLTLAEAAFLAGVDASQLRRLAEHLLQTQFDVPTDGDQVDERVARRLIELLAGRPITPPHPSYLLADRDPDSGNWRVQRGEVERFMADRAPSEMVMGFDLVCSAPKSLSLLWAVGDDRLRGDIAEAFDAAVDATIAYLEQHACYGKIDGRNQHGEGLGVVSFMHDTSRANEAHLHAHNLIVNTVRVEVRDSDGRPIIDTHGKPRVEWRALDSGALMRHVTTAGYVGAAELRHQLSSRWGIEWRRVRNGVAEIATFPADLLHAFSTRHDQVEEEFALMVEAGFEPGAATEAAAQRSSRAPKRVLADAAVRAVHAEKLAELGWTPGQVRDLVACQGKSGPLEVGETELAGLHDLLVGPAGLTERSTTFTSREVHQAIAQWAGDRLPAARVRAIAEGFLADRRVVLCGLVERARTRQDPDPVFTTEGLLAAEDNLLTLYRNGRVDHGAPPRLAIQNPIVEEAIAKVNRALIAERDDPSARLSAEQTDLVRAVLVGGDLVRCAIGPAGTGKTEAMRAAVAAWQAAGYRVVGCANGGAQTEQLAVRLGIDAQVVRSWLTRLETADDPAQIWPEGTVVVVDEATQISTRDAERLCRWAARTGTVATFIGDPAQLSSVGAGGWFRHVVYGHGAPSLSTVYRQQGDDLVEVRAALSGLRSEMPQRVRSAMDRLVKDGRVRIFDRPDDLLRQVVDDWYNDRQTRLAATTSHRSPKPSRMLAAHRREVETLNALARTRLIADGTITGPELTVGQCCFAVGEEVVTLTQAGHTLIPHGASRDHYIRTGTVGVITGVHLDRGHPEAQHVTVSFPGRGLVRVDWDYLTHEFADGRSGGLAYSYAITADRAQGSTMHSARTVATDTTSRPAFYVMVSRGEREVCAYVIRDRDLDSSMDDEQFLPVLKHPGGPLESVIDHLERSRAERLASDLDPVAWQAQQLRMGRSLAELSALRRQAESYPRGLDGGVSLVVARRAELAEEAAVGAAAFGSPAPELVARIGRRPAGGHHQRAWDSAVQAVAIYQSRWDATPDVAGYGHGAGWVLGPRPAVDRSLWAAQHNQAEQLAHRWSGTLDPLHRARFWAVIENIPRERATAGIHALVAAGVDPGRIYGTLVERESDTVNAGAAVLEHRVNKLLRAYDVDPAPYQMAEPLTGADEWDHVGRLLDVAEAIVISRTPISQLAHERRQLQDLIAGQPTQADCEQLAQDLGAAQSSYEEIAARLDEARRLLDQQVSRRWPDRRQIAALHQQIGMLEQRGGGESLAVTMLQQRLAATQDRTGLHEPLRERHQLITAAIDLIVDEAAQSFAANPANYLIGLLGPCPSDPDRAEGWDLQARAIEAWRHHTLGLPYGQPAAGNDAPPSQQALGPVPDDPLAALSRRRILDHCQTTLDLGISG